MYEISLTEKLHFQICDTDHICSNFMPFYTSNVVIYCYNVVGVFHCELFGCNSSTQPSVSSWLKLKLSTTLTALQNLAATANCLVLLQRNSKDSILRSW